MKILIDADACPVKAEIVRVGRSFNLEMIFVCDLAHEIDIPGTVTLVVDKGRDSADFKLVNIIQKGDLVITQDYGLAALALAKGAIVLNHFGKTYTHDTIDHLLFERHESAKARQAGHRFKGPKKRTREDDAAFEDALKRRIMDEQN